MKYILNTILILIMLGVSFNLLHHSLQFTSTKSYYSFLGWIGAMLSIIIFYWILDRFIFKNNEK